MLEALWSLEFISNMQAAGSGVVVMETGRVLGGDAQYIYVGTYKIHNSQAHSRIKVTHYANEPFSIFGPIKEFELELTGTPAHDKFEMQGHVVGRPNLRIGIRFTRRAELP